MAFNLIPHHNPTLGEKIGGAWEGFKAGADTLLTGKRDVPGLGGFVRVPVGHSLSAAVDSAKAADSQYKLQEGFKDELKDWADKVGGFVGGPSPDTGH